MQMVTNAGNEQRGRYQIIRKIWQYLYILGVLHIQVPKNYNMKGLLLLCLSIGIISCSKKSSSSGSAPQVTYKVGCPGGWERLYLDASDAPTNLTSLQPDGWSITFTPTTAGSTILTINAVSIAATEGNPNGPKLIASIYVNGKLVKSDTAGPTTGQTEAIYNLSC